MNRSLRTIRRWKRNGMPTRLHDGHREVHIEVLTAWFRERMTNWPPQQYRLRARRRASEALAIEEGRNDTPVVEVE